MARGENLATKATAGLERGADRIAGPGRGGREPGVSRLEGGPGKDSCRGQTAASGSPKGRRSATDACSASVRSNLYAHDRAGMISAVARQGSGPRLRPEQRGRLGRRDRPADVQGRRTFRRRRAATTRDAVARPEDALCERRRRQHADADRSASRAAPARRSPSTIPTTSTSRSTGATRSWSPSVCTGSTSAGHTFRLVRALSVPCAGVNHMDFSPNGHYVIASCEFSGRLLKVDVRHFRVSASEHCRAGSRCRRTCARRPTRRFST